MSDTPLLVIKNLHASIDGKQILRGLDLTVNPGEVHALMGPNGSGKSTLSNVIAGHPSYEVTEGEIHFMGQNITEMEPNERAKLGEHRGHVTPVHVSVLVEPRTSTRCDIHTGRQNSQAKQPHLKALDVAWSTFELMTNNLRHR